MTKSEYLALLEARMRSAGQEYTEAKEEGNEYAMAMANGHLNGLEVAWNFANYLSPNPTKIPIVELVNKFK